MNRLQKNEKLFSLQNALIFALGVLLLSFVLVMVWDCAEKCISKLLGLREKSEVLKSIGIGMGGILLALQALMSYKRAKALEDTAQAQADAANAQAKATEEQAKANQHIEQGQRQERMKNAIEHLGHDSDSVRLGGAYELFHLAQDTEELRQTVFDILCAHIRQTTSEKAYREAHKSKPSEGIQSLLTLLFVQEHEVFKGLRINLQESYLSGASLEGARLEYANLREAYLQGAKLMSASLQGAILPMARLQGADLNVTNLQGTDLYQTYLQGADLNVTNLQGAGLYQTHLQGAKLMLASLQGATLQEAHLQGASLSEAYLQGANLILASLQGADLEEAHLQGVRCEDSLPLYSFEDRIRASIDKETDLSELRAVFEGGLSQEDVDSFIEGLSDEKAKEELRETLKPHIDKPPSYQPPENSGAITGSYTAEEAEKWIAEYKEAISEVTPSTENPNAAL